MADRYFRRGTSKFRFAAVAPADPAAPLLSEVNAAVDLSPDVFDWAGWTVENARITTPDLATDFDSSIGGPDQPGNPSLSIYERLGETVYWTALEKGTTGFMYFCPEGVAATKPIETWPVVVVNRSRQPNTGAEAASFVAAFGVTSKPEQDGTIAAGP